MGTISTIRALPAVALTSAAALILAACSTNSPDTPSQPGESPAGDLSGVTLNVAAAWSGAEQENFEQVLDAFETATGARVNYTSFGDQAATTLGTQIAGGNPPDVAVLPQPALMQQYARDGNLAPLSQDTLAQVEANYAESWLELGSVDGVTYGVWFKASNKSTIWYNDDIYSQAGATAPGDWDDFLDQLQLVSDSGYAGISIGADVGWPLTDWFENVYLRTAGPDMYDQLTNHEIPWTDPSVAEALEVLATLWGTNLVQSGAAQRTFPETVTEVFGANPAAGTVYEGDFVAGNIADDGNSTVGVNALFYDFPTINGSAPSVVGGGDVAVAFNDNPGTQALMTFLASAESAEVWVPLGGMTSPNQGVDVSLYPDDISRQVAQALTGAEVFRFDMSDLTPSAFGGTTGQGFWQIMIEFLENPSDIEGTQQKLEDAALSAY